MAYSALPQGEHDTHVPVTFDAYTSDGSPSPPQHLRNDYTFQPITLHFENLGGGLFMDEPTLPSTVTSGMTRQSHGPSMGTSAALEERHTASTRGPDDSMARVSGTDFPPEYDNVPPPLPPPHRQHSRPASSSKTDVRPTDPPHTIPPGEQPTRTASSAGSTLRHPAPDLQSLQGAYVKNVQRIEQSAERLSLTSDIEGEVRKMRQEQRRSESRQSSLLNSPVEEEEGPLATLSRQLSTSSRSNPIARLNSAARSGAYSSNGYGTPPRGLSMKERMRSSSKASRLSQLPEPQLEGRPLDISPAPTSPVAPDPPSHGTTNHRQDAEAIERPGTSGSIDTYQQAKNLFTDFDGVHYDEPTAFDLEQDRSFTPNVMESQPVLRQKVFVDPRTQGMVYYPAPVPRTLNLPQKLSRQPDAAQRDRRQTQVLSGLPNASRKSAAWLSNVNEEEHKRRSRAPRLGPDEAVPPEAQGGEGKPETTKDLQRSTNHLGNIPPQLRATAFFDHPIGRQDVEVKDNSAVATLESILDASAVAPVRAFTDHPIAGEIGGEVYKKEESRKSTSNLLGQGAKHKKQRSSINLLRDNNGKKSSLEHVRANNASRGSLGSFLGFRKVSAENGGPAANDQSPDPNGNLEPLRLSTDLNHHAGSDVEGQEHQLEDGWVAEDEEEGEEEEASGSEESVKEEDPDLALPPTTLLAELQIRKAQLKNRGRTAATAFPTGMHSTLLELDTVAQRQKDTRRHKRIALAWEDPSAYTQEDEAADDDDVPLGLLFPGRDGKGNKERRRLDDQRPLGLMERRELEDNEPLSKRRLRLRGETSTEPSPHLHQRSFPQLREQALPNHSPEQRASTRSFLEVPGLTDNKPENSDSEEETMAQRKARIKRNEEAAKRQSVVTSSAFADDLLSQLGGVAPSKPVDDTFRTESPPEEEETLAQRRRRLQTQASSGSFGAAARPRQASHETGVNAQRPFIKQRRSMADLLQARPALGSRNISSELGAPGSGGAGGTKAGGLLAQQEQSRTARQEAIRQQNRVSTMSGLDRTMLVGLETYDAQDAPNTTFRDGLYDEGNGGMAPNGGMGIEAANSSAMGMNFMYQQQQQQQQMLAASSLWNYPYQQQQMPYTQSMMGYPMQAQYGAYGSPMGFTGTQPGFAAQEEVALDPRQRSQIDNWRHGVMP